MLVYKRQDGRPGISMMSFEEYKTNTQSFFTENSFYEREVARRVERFGHIAHVFITYAVYHVLNAEPYARGINSIQLWWT